MSASTAQASFQCLEDTNDIGFQAVEVRMDSGLRPASGSGYASAGLTGHRSFAGDTGVVVKPSDACMVADAVVRAFIDTGDRTDRNKARLKYVLDRMGVDTFLALVEESVRPQARSRRAAGAIAPRPSSRATAHIGVHPQKQNGLHWIGGRSPVGRMTVAQMRGLAGCRARLRGRRHPTHRLAEPVHLRRCDGQACGGARDESRQIGLSIEPSAFATGLVACTGTSGCKFAASDTKRHARRDCVVVRDARRARQTGQHPFDRMPSLLRPAFHL